MKKTITLIFFMCIGLFGLMAQHAGEVFVPITEETFSGATPTQNFDTDFKIPHRGWNSGANYSWTWTAAADSGVFTIENGHWITGSDSSIRVVSSQYGGIDQLAQPWPDSSQSRCVLLTPYYRYAGSWDTVIMKDIEITGYSDMVLNFGIVKRSNGTPKDTLNSGIFIYAIVDGGAPVLLTDTMDIADSIQPGLWTYATVNLPTAMVGDTLDLVFDAGMRNLNFLDDIKLSGWTAMTMVNNFTITAAGGATTITTGGGTLQMAAEAFPKDADDTTFSWSVVDGTGMATISAGGLLTAVCNGTVNVTATANDPGAFSEAYVVTLSGQTYAVQSVAVTSTGNSITTKGGTKQMTATVTPACANDVAIVWSLSPAGYATIDANGLLTAVSDGTVTVTATNAASGKFGTKNIIVANQSTSLTDITSAGIILSPNPVVDVLNLSNTALVSRIEIIGMNGSTVKTVVNDASNRLSINASDLNSGVYFIKVQTTDGKVLNSKFVKE